MTPRDRGFLRLVRSDIKRMTQLLPEEVVRVLLKVGPVVEVHLRARPARWLFIFDRRNPEISAVLRGVKALRSAAGFVAGHTLLPGGKPSRMVFAVLPLFGARRVDLDTLLHELIHVINPELSEAHVSMWAGAVSEILWRMGWRKQKVESGAQGSRVSRGRMR